MNIWTTFTPRKVSWELTCIMTKGKAPDGNWQKNIKLIDESLRKLKGAGISGIRLVIYPSELTTDGKKFNWSPIDALLLLCTKYKIQTDLCIGPFQYPNYPGVYFPSDLVKQVSGNSEYIDSDPVLKAYGIRFLRVQLKRYGKDKRVHGFHLANEWPDRQVVEGKKNLRLTASEDFMLEATKLIKKLTAKPILLNTNIDAADKNKITKVFGNLLHALSDQGKLGMDIYPSRETWRYVPLQKLRRLVWPYSRSFKKVQENFSSCEIYFAEVEAQPWGSGQSWYQLIKEEADPQKKVLSYSVDSLSATWKKHIASSNCRTVSLWGSDFWLSADMMGITWPLSQIKRLHDILIPAKK